MVEFDTARAQELLVGLIERGRYAPYSPRDDAFAAVQVLKEFRTHYEQQIRQLESRIVELQSSDAILGALGRIEKLLTEKGVTK